MGEQNCGRAGQAERACERCGKMSCLHPEDASPETRWICHRCDDGRIEETPAQMAARLVLDPIGSAGDQRVEVAQVRATYETVHYDGSDIVRVRLVSRDAEQEDREDREEIVLPQREWSAEVARSAIRSALAHASDPAALAGELRRAIVAGLGAAAGDGVEVWNGREGVLESVPAGGALLKVRWAVEDQSRTRWYPTVERAKAALAALAAHHGRVPDEDGMGVDLTSPGCHPSWAKVEA